MSFRNVDGCSELVESERAQFDTGILSVNSEHRQRGYIGRLQAEGCDRKLPQFE